MGRRAASVGARPELAVPLGENPVGSFAGEFAGGSGSFCLYVESEKRFGAGQTHEHPGAVFEGEFCAVSAVDGFDFAAEKSWRLGFGFLHGAGFLVGGEVKIFACGSEGAPDFFKKLLNLFADRSVAGGHHFSHQEAGQDAVFFRDVAADGKARAFFAAEGDFIFADQLANVFEADRSLVNGLAVEPCCSVNEFGCSYAACGGKFPSARFNQVIVNQGEDEIGLNPSAVGVYNAEAVGVAVGCKPGGGFRGKHKGAEGSEIFLADIGAGAVEKHIAIGADGFRGHAMVDENFVEIAGAAAVQRVNNKSLFGIGEDVEPYQLLQTLEIVFAQIGGFGGLGLDFERGNATGGEEPGCSAFDVLGDFGKGRTGIGGRKFQAVILRWIVAGGV